MSHISSPWVLAGILGFITLGCAPKSTGDSIPVPSNSADTSQGRLKIGDKAPLGSVYTASSNEAVQLSDHWSDKTAVVVFYRGHW